MVLTLTPEAPFLVAEWQKPPGFSRVFSHNTGRLAPYRYQSQLHFALAYKLTNPYYFCAGIGRSFGYNRWFLKKAFDA